VGKKREKRRERERKGWEEERREMEGVRREDCESVFFDSFALEKIVKIYFRKQDS